MALTKLSGFTGEAEVLGRLIRVEYEESRGLVLVGISHDEALTALDKLANKALVAVNPKAATKASQQVATAPTAAPETKPYAETSKALESAKVLPQQEVVPKIEQPSTPEKVTPVVVEYFAKQMNQMFAAQPEAQPAVESKTDVDLTKAKQLKDVLLMLQDAFGIKDTETMVKKCVELQDSVPVLKRIADVPSRVKRTMELLGQ